MKTRVTRENCSTHYGIKQKLISYHEHNETGANGRICANLLEQGKSIAVVSDAGTPAICDPALRIVQKAHEIGAKVTAIPGAVAFVSALIVSGFPTDSFFSAVFCRQKKTTDASVWKKQRKFRRRFCFYETPHRIAKSLVDCLEILGNRNAAVVREITKLHEENVRGTLKELSEKYFAGKCKRRNCFDY